MKALFLAPEARPAVAGRYALALLPAAPVRPAPAPLMVVPCCPPASAPQAASDETVWAD